MAKPTQPQHMDEVQAYPEEFISPAASGTIHVDGDETPPQAPASVQTTNKVGKVTVSWGSVPDNDLERYKVYYGTTGGFSTASAFGTDTADVTSYDHSSEYYGTTFAYKVSAIDYSKNESNLSAEVSGSPQRSGSQDLADNSITETKIGSESVTTPKLVANAVTTDKITASAVTANEIEASAITTTKLAANAVVANKMAVGTLSAIAVNMGTLSAGRASFAGGDVEIGESVTSSGDGIYVGQGGGIEVTDTDGSTVFDSNNRFLGGKIINAGAVDDSNNYDLVTVVSNGYTVPSNKKWVLMVTQTSRGLVQTMNANVVDLVRWGVYGNFSAGTGNNVLTSGSYSGSLEINLYHYVEVTRDDGTNFTDNVEAGWLVVEVPA